MNAMWEHIVILFAGAAGACIWGVEFHAFQVWLESWCAGRHFND